VGHPEWKPQRAVFVADGDQEIWIVENPEAVANFPATHVVLAGKFDSAKKTIHIEKITPASPPDKFGPVPTWTVSGLEDGCGSVPSDAPFTITARLD
jgi:hypothetical protein